MKKGVFFLSFLFFITLTLTIVHVIISNSLSTTGVGLNTIEKEIAFYKKQNMLIKERLLSLSSLTRISLEASKSGFVDETSRVFVNKTVPLAIR